MTPYRRPEGYGIGQALEDWIVTLVVLVSGRVIDDVLGLIYPSDMPTIAIYLLRALQGATYFSITRALWRSFYATYSMVKVTVAAIVGEAIAHPLSALVMFAFSSHFLSIVLENNLPVVVFGGSLAAVGTGAFSARSPEATVWLSAAFGCGYCY